MYTEQEKEQISFLYLGEEGEKEGERSTPEYPQHSCTHGFYRKVY